MVRFKLWVIPVIALVAVLFIRPAPLVVNEAHRPAHCHPMAPQACGQLRIATEGFFDYGGPWVMHGVQFFIPSLGINGRSFWDAQYHTALKDGTVPYWLDRAQQYLHANTLRIFVDLPLDQAGQTLMPTTHHTIVDFARQASARGMRLGISLHNDDDWIMTPARQAWIEELLSAFLRDNMLSTIAYLNLDNEINNHCDPAHRRDCFATMPPWYRDRALHWVRLGTQIIKARAPQMLVTVGMSTELDAPPASGGAENYFVPDQQGDTIASLVDFLSPHNYGGGAALIIAAIRQHGYAQPVILEEYGFPTDPAPLRRVWSEGPPECRLTPLVEACRETAPFYVETNLNALRTTSYAGGVAWMLADTQEKDLPTACSDPTIPSDLWTGIFAVGGRYCEGGTRTQAMGAPKATAVRICIYHTGQTLLCTTPLNGR